MNSSDASATGELGGFTSIEVGSRLWPVALVGRRSYANTREVMRKVRDRMSLGANPPLVVTDSFDYYPRVIREVFGPMCLFGQTLRAAPPRAQIRT